MPRSYKSLPGTRQYGTKTAYSAQLLETVVEEIRSGKIGQREASRKYKIPRQTLVNKLNNKHCKKVGKPVIFSEEEEDCFVAHTIYVSKMGIPIGMYDLRLIIKGYLDSNNRKIKCFKNNMPGYEWGKSFLKRHKLALKECFAKNISQKRAAVNEEIINNFFDNFEKEIENVPDSNIFNMDETGFHDNPASKKLLFPRSLRHPEKVLNQTKTCYTGVFCGSASGKLLPPYFIMKGKNKWGNWLLNASPGARMNITDSGWMEQEVMEDWIENMFLPWLRKNDISGKKILICDNLSAHISIKALKMCTENEISFLTFPANATHLLQPLDLSFFGSLKSQWRSVLTEWRSTADGKKKVALPKGTFVALVKETLDLGSHNVEEIVKKGFEKGGLCPVNRKKVIDSLPLYARNEINTVANVSNEFQKYLEDIREKDLGIKTVEKWKIPSEPGKSISAEEVENYYKEKEKEKEQKKKQKEERIKKIEEKKKQRIDRARFGPRTRGGLRPQGLMRSKVQNPEEDTSLTVVKDSSPTSVASEAVANEVNSFPIAGLETDILVDDFVMVKYNDKLFPGKVSEINLMVDTPNTYKVRCMTKKGKYWVWPDRDDEIFYEREDVVKKIDLNCIKLINKRGMYEIKERLLYSEEEFELY